VSVFLPQDSDDEEEHFGDQAPPDSSDAEQVLNDSDDETPHQDTVEKGSQPKVASWVHRANMNRM